jgi:hypothetical protein
MSAGQLPPGEQPPVHALVEPDRGDLLVDPRRLKGLAHPIRVRLRGELANHGPATATQLAARIGESSGSTSYHLRQLAAYGFVEEDPGLGTGRERYWRSVHRAIFYHGPDDDPASRELGGEYMRAVARVQGDRIVHFADAIEAVSEVVGGEWANTWDMSDWSLDLTPAEARDLARAFHELCAPHRHEQGTQPPGTRMVRVQFQVMPTLEWAADQDPGPATDGTGSS